MVVHKQHIREDDVAALDVRFRARGRFRIAAPLGGRVQRERQPRQLRFELGANAIDRARDMAVERDDHEMERRRFGPLGR